MELTADQERYWQAYLDRRRPADPTNFTMPRVTAGYAGSPEIADELLGLYLDGTKTAGSSLLADYRAAGDPLPEVGDHWIVLDGDGAPRCILRTTRVEQHRFADITPEIAFAEGEGDRSVAYWKCVHADSYAPDLEAWGIDDLAAATVVTEFFELVSR